MTKEKIERIISPTTHEELMAESIEFGVLGNQIKVLFDRKNHGISKLIDKVEVQKYWINFLLIIVCILGLWLFLKYTTSVEPLEFFNTSPNNANHEAIKPGSIR